MPHYLIPLTFFLQAPSKEEAERCARRHLGCIPRYAGFSGAVEVEMGKAREVVDRKVEETGQ